MSKPIDTIVDEVLRSVERVLRNEIPNETCPEKREKAEWKKGQVREKVVSKLQEDIHAIGPMQTKG